MSDQTNSAQGAAEGAKSKPPIEVKIGRIKGLVWENSGQNGETYSSVTLARLYKDGDEWKETASFGKADLPTVAKVIAEIEKVLSPVTVRIPDSSNQQS